MIYGHTVDSVNQYRIEIGWLTEPIVSGETNALELYVSELEPGVEPEDQIFKDGISDLKNTLKVSLVFKDDKIILPLVPDHNIAGKYLAFVNPTVSGYYQADIVGTINETPVNLSMHPPKVAERSYIEFPEPADLTVTQIIDSHTALISEISDLKKSVKSIQESNNQDFGYIGTIIGVIGIAIAAVALLRTLQYRKSS